MLHWRWLLLWYKQCPLSIEATQNLFVHFCTSMWKLFNFLFFCVVSKVPIYCSLSGLLYQILLSGKNWCEGVVSWAEWRSVQLSVCGLFLHSVQIQFQWEYMCNERTTFGYSAENCYIQSIFGRIERIPIVL